MLFNGTRLFLGRGLLLEVYIIINENAYGKDL